MIVVWRFWESWGALRVGMVAFHAFIWENRPFHMSPVIQIPGNWWMHHTNVDVSTHECSFAPTKISASRLSSCVLWLLKRRFDDEVSKKKIDSFFLFSFWKNNVFLMGKMMIKVIWCCLLLSQTSGWNVSIKQVIKFTPVAEPAQKPGSYKETLRSVWFPGWNYFVYAWSGGSLTGSGFPIWNLYIFISGWDTKQKFIQQ